MSKDAMKLALEALEGIHPGNMTPMAEEYWNKAITALREALAEPQEKYQYGTPLLDAMRGKANEALDKKAKNARELGLDYEPAQQEPVGTYGEIYQAIRELLQSGKVADQQIYLAMKDKPLYTSPPAQRTWVGLTDEEKQKIMWVFTQPNGLFKHFKYMEAVEAKLKEKNT